MSKQSKDRRTSVDTVGARTMAFKTHKVSNSCTTETYKWSRRWFRRNLIWGWPKGCFLYHLGSCHEDRHAVKPSVNAVCFLNSAITSRYVRSIIGTVKDLFENLSLLVAGPKKYLDQYAWRPFFLIFPILSMASWPIGTPALAVAQTYKLSLNACHVWPRAPV